MYKDDEQWINNIKQRLENHSEPLPDDGWAKLEQSLGRLPATAPLPATEGRPAPKGRILLLRSLMAAAGIALLIGLSTLTFRLLQPSPNVATPNVAPVVAVVPDTPSKEPVTVPDEPLPQQTVVRRRAGSGQYRQLAMATVAEPADDKDDKKPAATQAPQTDEKKPVEMDNKEQPEERQQPDVQPVERTYRPARHSELPLQGERRAGRRKAEGWSTGLSVAGVGSSVTNRYGAVYGLLSHDPNVGGQLNLADASENPVEIEEGEGVVFKNGIPYTNNSRVKSIKHRQPVSVAVNVRKGLPLGFSVEAGVMYTRLVSDAVLAETGATVTQRLHYIGIPVRANWNFVTRERFTAYLSAGGAVEKCVYGTLGSETVTVNPLQLSVSAAAGAQLNLTKHLGVYVEPGVSHYFDDGSDVETIRKERTLNFTLQAGLRLMY
jgi:hypothetical protein